MSPNKQRPFDPTSLPTAHVSRRCLLALGMMCGSNADAQAQLAGTPGSIKRILGFSRTSTDEDAQLVSKGLFANLARNPELRDSIEAALRMEDKEIFV